MALRYAALCASIICCIWPLIHAAQPNFIIILADDVGWGDIGAYGSPSIRTPVLDHMIQHGLKFDSLYTAQPICTPSRGAMLSGRQPVRVGMYQDVQLNNTQCSPAHGLSSVLWWDSLGGLQNDTLLLPQALDKAGYHTALVGKWHVGIGRHLEYLPLQKGFDEFFGTPLWHMNNMGNESQIPDCPLMEGNKMLGRLYKDINVHELTQRYMARVLSIIDEHQNDPFFIFYTPDGTHEPTYASAAFQNKSARGAYGDAMEEMDWSIGQILQRLRERKLDDNTFVFFSSDNGPALYATVERPTLSGKLQAGSAGPLKGGKGTTWEGGIRMPGVAYWPGKIQPNRVTQELVSLMDIMPTVLELAGVSVPPNYALDGVSMTNILFNETASSKHEFLFHWRGDTLYAVTYGFYKAHFWTQGGTMYTTPGIQQHDPPLIFNVMADVSEQFPLAGPQDDPNYDAVLAAVVQAAKNEIASMDPAPPQFNVCDPAAGMWSPDLPIPPSKPYCCVGGGN